MPRLIFRTATMLFLGLGACRGIAEAQVSIAGYNIKAGRQVRVEDKHWMLTGSVELEQGDTKFYADAVELFENQDRVVARGNVVLVQGNNRIAADRAEFNTKTRFGTFYRASGIASVQPPRQTPQPGAIIVPMVAGQETDVYFFGETVEKIGTKKYRITNGGFSTCVQPTPRWDLSADTVVLNVDHYTLLRQAILKVKGVPMFYLPILYYPTKEDGRATGFLLPTYGLSSIRGQSIHNAFFWAINRSQDATFLYDWYSKTGNGGGAEYRYMMGAGAGDLTTYLLDERAVTFQRADGSSISQAASRSYTIYGGANQNLPLGLRARANVSYFSSIQSNLTFNTNVNNTALNNRSYGGNVVGAWRSYSLNATFDRREWFNNTTSSAVQGSSPRVTFSRSERQLFNNAPVYFGFASEGAHLDRLTKNVDTVIDDRSVGRMDFLPVVKYPFKRWQWFTVNSSFAWRETFYTRSLDPATRAPSSADVNRQFFTVQAQAVGPVLTRVWDAPDNGYASRFKHSIEPFFTVQRTSPIDQRDRIIAVDGSDGIYGDTTSVNYGLNNRIFAKRRIGQSGSAQEIVAVDMNQTYYSQAAASTVDPRYATSYTGGQPNHFSPISLGVRVTPTNFFNANLRAELDSRYRELRTLSVNGSYSYAQYMQASVGWSHKFLIRELIGFNDPNVLDHYVNFSTYVHTGDNKYGSNYSFNYDVLRSRMLQQRINAFYNAQCCGIAFEYQRYNLTGASFLLPSDRRFFLSFTLAGLGNFSPFNGGLSGVPR